MQAGFSTGILPYWDLVTTNYSWNQETINRIIGLINSMKTDCPAHHVTMTVGRCPSTATPQAFHPDGRNLGWHKNGSMNRLLRILSAAFVPLHAKVHDEEDSTTDELRRFLQRIKFERYEISKQAKAMLRFNIISGAREVAEFALPSFWSQKRLQPICDDLRGVFRSSHCLHVARRKFDPQYYPGHEFFGNGTGLSLHYFASTTVAGTPNEEKVRAIGKTDKDLIRFLDERCPTKAVETLGMIILTTHTTLMRRTVSMTSEGHRDRKKLRSKGITLQETFEGRDEFSADMHDVDGEKIGWKDSWFKIDSRLRARFGMMFIDEAHQIQGIRTCTFRGLKDLCVASLFFVSATLEINQVSDWTGFLRLLYQKEFKQLTLTKSTMDEAEEAKDPAMRSSAVWIHF
ncbi:hypothetical protein KCU93_g8702, partial [Aureobasidium melanogenum]